MDPDIFLAPGTEHIQLIQALCRFAEHVQPADDRLAALKGADIVDPFFRNLNCSTGPLFFANKLVAKFSDFPVSMSKPEYHPMIKLLEFLLEMSPYPLDDQEIIFFSDLVKRGQENFKALKARDAVGRIESPLKNAIGTGVFLGKGLLLTCSHIFKEISGQPTWVHFGYKKGRDGKVREEVGEVLALDLQFASSRSHLDYAIVKIKGEPKHYHANLNKEADEGQEVHLIHHPHGQPVEVSGIGSIVQRDADYIDHTIPADHGSSGAPILNGDWQVIAVHRGYPGIGRTVLPDTVEGIPLSAIWDKIPPYVFSE